MTQLLDMLTEDIINNFDLFHNCSVYVKDDILPLLENQDNQPKTTDESQGQYYINDQVCINQIYNISVSLLF